VTRPSRLRYFSNRMPPHPSEQHPLEKNSALSVLSVDKKWVMDISPRQGISSFRDKKAKHE